MPPNVVSTASLMCTFGAAPSPLTVLPVGRVMIEGMPAASIMDMQPMVNIASFGVCMTPTNPQVAAATAAALGVLTPQPCIPVTTAPWTPGSATTMVGGKPALTVGSTCMCMWGGVISPTMPGSMKTMTN